MEIKVLGDFEMAREILLGVARLFSNPDGALITSAPATILSGFLLWTFLKWGMDNEKAPFPAKEFVFGIVFWLIFGGGAVSPKYDVELTSIRENRFQVIDDVPFLAAVPSWLASNFFGSAKAILEDNFSPLHYSIASDQRTPDPLSALIKLYDNGSALIIDPYLSRSISTYMVDCYDVEQRLTGTPNTLTRRELDAMPVNTVWKGVEVTYNFITAMYYTEGDKNGSEMDCNTIWKNIDAMVLNETSDFSKKLVNINASKGMTNDAIASASKMIYAASTHSSPNPTEIQQGLFLSYMMRDGLSKTNIETWSDKMMFEAQRKRVIESAGERNMFIQVMIPIITAVETFSFFIAPVMMVLSVLGGHGLALILKYLMLVLFVNLWGFVKVFVDLFTAMTVERAFQAAEMGDPFAFGAYGQTFNEIEGFLSVASSMTVAIPMFAMFLLYGGVHSVMGVMRTLGGGSVDGNMVAPTMGSSMNGNVMTQGDTTYTQMVGSGQFAVAHASGTDASLGSGNVTNATSGTLSNTSQTAKQEVSNNMQTWQQSVSDAYGVKNAVSTNDSGGNSIDFRTLSDRQRMGVITKQLSESGDMTTAQADSAMATIMATGGAGVSVSTGLGSQVVKTAARAQLSADGKAAYQEGLTKEQRASHAKAVGLINSWGKTDSFGESATGGVSYSNINTRSGVASDDDSTSKVDTATQQVNNSVTKSSAIGRAIATQQAVGQTSMIDWNALDPNIKGGTEAGLTSLYQSLPKDEQQRLASLGIGSPDELMTLTQAATGNGASFAANVQKMEQVLGKGDGNLQQSALDHQIMGGVYRFAGNNIPDAHKGGFYAASNAHKNIANTINGVDAVDGAIRPAETGNVGTAQEVEAKANSVQQAAEKKNRDTPTVQAMQDNVTNSTRTDEKGNKQPVFGPDNKPINNVEQSPKEFEQRLKAARSVEAPKNGNKELLSAVGEVGREALAFASKMLTTPGEVWGKDGTERAARMNTGFIQLQDSHSMAAERGIEMFMKSDQKEIQGAFTANSTNGGQGPNADAYAMNDAYTLLKTPAGQDFVKGLPEGEDKNRFTAAVGMFETNKQAFSQYAAQMDEVSARRIDGSLVEPAASVLIANASQAERIPLMQPGNDYRTSDIEGKSKDETRGAAHIIANTPSLNESPIIRSMAGYRADEEIKPGSEGDGNDARRVGKEMIVNDEIQRMQASGAYNFTPGADNGRNINLKDENLKDGVEFMLGGGREISASGAFRLHTEGGNWAKDLLVGSNESRAAGVAALANAGTDTLESRLANAGYKDEAKQVSAFNDASSAMAFEQGSITTGDRQQAFQDIGAAAIFHQPIPQDVLASVSPTDIQNNQVLDRKSFNSSGHDVTNQTPSDVNGATSGAGGYADRERLASELRPSVAQSVAIAEGDDGRVLFRGESTYKANKLTESGFANASNKADHEATVAAALVGVHDKAMNLAFNSAKRENDGEAPASFRSGTNQEYVRENNEDGSISYNGGVMGRFTYTDGDNRLMPTEDNRNYHPLSSVDRLHVGTEGAGWKPKEEK